MIMQKSSLKLGMGVRSTVAGSRVEQMKENLEKDMLSHCPPSATSPTLMGKGFRRLASPKKVTFQLSYHS